VSIPRLSRLGDHAWLVSFEPRVDADTSARVLAAATWIVGQRWPGVRDVVPALTSVAVHLSPECAEAGEIQRLIADHLTRWTAPTHAEGPVIEIVVSYGGSDGPDLAAVAEAVQLDPGEVVRRHCAVTYRVFMLGFLPGFPYLGPVDPSIQVPRLAVPRTRVPAGSVGLAGPQTGIYPRESPGGWQIIGRTTEILFDVSRTPPARLTPGDRVRFVPRAAASHEVA
jgi:KipI family sensor histidine kinase inhibitor